LILSHSYVSFARCEAVMLGLCKMMADVILGTGIAYNDDNV